MLGKNANHQIIVHRVYDLRMKQSGRSVDFVFSNNKLKLNILILMSLVHKHSTKKYIYMDCDTVMYSQAAYFISSASMVYL